MPGMITCEDDPIILIRWWRWSGMMPGMITWSWFHEFDQIRKIVTDVTGLEYRLIDVLVRYHMLQKMSYLRRPMKPTQSPALVAEHWRSPFPEEVLRAVACKCGVKKMVQRLTIVKKKKRRWWSWYLLVAVDYWSPCQTSWRSVLSNWSCNIRTLGGHKCWSSFLLEWECMDDSIYGDGLERQSL